MHGRFRGLRSFRNFSYRFERERERERERELDRLRRVSVCR